MNYCTAPTKMMGFRLVRRTLRTKLADMPRKKKPKRFRAVKAVKEMARERIGTPRPTQVVPGRKKTTPEKHKPTLGDLLDEG